MSESTGKDRFVRFAVLEMKMAAGRKRRMHRYYSCSVNSSVATGSSPLFRHSSPSFVTLPQRHRSMILQPNRQHRFWCSNFTWESKTRSRGRRRESSPSGDGDLKKSRSGANFMLRSVLMSKTRNETFNKGSLGSRIDEERREERAC